MSLYSEQKQAETMHENLVDLSCGKSQVKVHVEEINLQEKGTVRILEYGQEDSPFPWKPYAGV